MAIWELLSAAREAGASDLHLCAGMAPAMRCDGEVVIGAGEALTTHEVETFLRELMSQAQWSAFENDKECDFSVAARDGVRYRVNAFWQERGAAAVFRIILSQLRSLEELECPAILKKIAARHSGLLLVTGPTGSGKTTTLAAVIDHLNRTRPYHIITVEDPVEFIHTPQRALINQREVHRHTLGFANALRAALREDPDCILVGELRDLETIRLALTAAETGHLVLATLHTNSAAHTLDRMIDVFPAGEKELVRAMLAEALSAVVCQRLVRRAGGGRVAAWEVMVCTPAIRNLIREGKTAQMHSAIQTGQAQGMVTLEASLRDLVAKGVVTQADTAGILG